VTTAAVILLADTPNPVPPGDQIATSITVTLGDAAGASLAIGDNVTLNLTLPTGITTVPSSGPGGITETTFEVTQAGVQPFALRFAIDASVAPGLKSIPYTWTDHASNQAPVSGGTFNLVVGFSKTATLVYTAAPVPPVSLARLVTAMTDAAPDFASIKQLAGVSKVSDATAASGGNAQRTIVFALPYPVRQQFNGNDALPPNTTTRQFFVVTTTGPNASIGQLIYDNGSGKGTTVVVLASASLVIETIGKTDFVGGITLLTGHEYAWSGIAWVDGGASSIGSNAFQQSFPMTSGAQAKAFNSLYQATFGALLGSVVTSTVAIGT
jgi:hypothetical protein